MCPSDRYAIDPNATSVAGSRNGFGLSYEVNDNIFYSEYGDTSPQHYIGVPPNSWQQISALQSDIIAPSRTVLLGENWGNLGVPQFAAHTTECPVFDGHLRWWQCASMLRHSGGSNFAMCDGSVKWVIAADYRTLTFYRDGRQVPASFWPAPDVPTNP
jgi:prepilin-type processing-associated H-X9-DG protein